MRSLLVRLRHQTMIRQSLPVADVGTGQDLRPCRRFQRPAPRTFCVPAQRIESPTDRSKRGRRPQQTGPVEQPREVAAADLNAASHASPSPYY